MPSAKVGAKFRNLTLIAYLCRAKLQIINNILLYSEKFLFMEEIKFGKYVELAYKVFTTNGKTDELMHEFPESTPDRFVYGLEQGMIEGFAKRIEGMKKGEKFEFVLAPAEAFGETNPDMIITLDKSIFMVDGEFDAETVKVGNVVPMMTEQGNRVHGVVTHVGADKVVMDFNHPLAGEQVKYVGTVIEVRDSTAEERNPKHGGCGGCSGCGSAEGGSCGGCNGCND